MLIYIYSFVVISIVKRLGYFLRQLGTELFSKWSITRSKQWSNDSVGTTSLHTPTESKALPPAVAKLHRLILHFIQSQPARLSLSQSIVTCQSLKVLPVSAVISAALTFYNCGCATTSDQTSPSHEDVPTWRPIPHHHQRSPCSG